MTFLENKQTFNFLLEESNIELNFINIKSNLEIYGTDLTPLAKEGKFDECFGREQELLELMEILVRKNKNNPVLIGEAGIGKTAIIELFSKKMINNLVPFVLQGRTIINLDLTRLIAGTKFRGDFELRFQQFFNEILQISNIIIFIDEIHLIITGGNSDGSNDLAQMLKPLLSRPGLQLIGATTPKEYQIIEKDFALNRRFQPLYIKEPSINDTINILYNLRPSLEAFHNIEIEPAAIKLAVELSSRYIFDRFLPDKAIDIIDRAAAKQVIKLTNLSEKSVINSIINGSLINISILRYEAARRGDIASEFIFQEIENAYRNFLLRWLESPLSIPLEPNTIISPISKIFFDKMKLSVLNKIDELLFLSSEKNYTKKVLKQTKNLSSIQNKKIFKNLITYNFDKLSNYRILLFLTINWLQIKNIKKLKENIFLIIKNKIFFNMYKYICFLKYYHKTNYILYKNINEFYNNDTESIEQITKNFSQLDEQKINIFNDYLFNLKPILHKGIIESLKYSSKINLSTSELNLIYNLLGYFSITNNSKTIDYNFNLLQKHQPLNLKTFQNKITENEIRDLISNMIGIPIQSLSAVEAKKLLNLELILHKRVIGQEEAIAAVAKAIRRSRLGIQMPDRPIASFLFCGPTGVGKTEITKALAEIMFGSEKEMIRFDMSEFMEKFTISRLIGSPPGYIGYDEGGQLTNAIRTKPYSIVLFDEVEKAHPAILNILLQILEDGRLTDSQKRLVKFDNSIIILTSNVGAEEIQYIIKKERTSIKNENVEINLTNNINLLTNNYEDNYSGVINFLKSPITENFLDDIKKQLKIEFEKSFNTLKEYQFLENKIIKKNSEFKIKNPEETKNLLKETVLSALNKLFLPEFLNRLDDIIIFLPLKIEELRKICDIMLNNLIARLKLKQIFLYIDENVKIKLTKDGYNPIFGARPLRRLVTKYIEDIISDNLLNNTVFKKSRQLKITLNDNNKIIII
jgi:ATP-dependent Clp protease ATP-binding subunit ClpA